MPVQGIYCFYYPIVISMTKRFKIGSLQKVSLCGKDRYVEVPNVTKRPRKISNPDGLSLSLKYLLAIKMNLSILILAYPKWSILPTVIFTTDSTADSTSICGYPCTLSLSLSLSASLLSCTLAPSFRFI